MVLTTVTNFKLQNIPSTRLIIQMEDIGSKSTRRGSRRGKPKKRKNSVLSLNKLCSDEHLHQISLLIAEWRDFAPALGLTQPDEAEISGRAPLSVPAQRLHMLRLWKQKNGTAATYQRLADAFRNCVRQDLVDKISELVSAAQQESTESASAAVASSAAQQELTDSTSSVVASSAAQQESTDNTSSSVVASSAAQQESTDNTSSSHTPGEQCANVVVSVAILRKSICARYQYNNIVAKMKLRNEYITISTA